MGVLSVEKMPPLLGDLTLKTGNLVVETGDVLFRHPETGEMCSLYQWWSNVTVAIEELKTRLIDVEDQLQKKPSTLSPVVAPPQISNDKLE